MKLEGLRLFASRMLRIYGENNLPQLCAASAYFLTISIIPLLFIAASLLGYFLSGYEASNLFRFLDFPVFGEALKANLDFLLGKKGTLGLLGALSMLWISRKHPLFLRLRPCPDS